MGPRRWLAARRRAGPPGEFPPSTTGPTVGSWSRPTSHVLRYFRCIVRERRPSGRRSSCPAVRVARVAAWSGPPGSSTTGGSATSAPRSSTTWTTSTTRPSSTSSWRPRLPLLRARHAGRGPQPRLPALQGRRSGTGVEPRCGRRLSADVERLFTSTGGVGIWGHLARPRSAPGTWTPGPGHRPRLPQRARRRAAVGPVVPRAGRPDRHRAGLGRAGGLLPGLRRVRGRLLAGRLARRPAGRPATTSTTSTTWAACGWPASAPAGRWPCARRPTTRGCGAWRPWARRPTSTTGPAIPGGCCCTPATWASSARRRSPRRSTRGRASCARSGRWPRRPRLRPRPLLVLHGSDDESVPVFDARVLADAHGDADLRIIDGAGHQLRHDPRAVAVLLGWLDRQRNQAASAH